MRPLSIQARLWLIARLALLAMLAGCGGSDSDAPAPAPSTDLSSAEACAALKSVTLTAAEISLPTSGAAVGDAALVAPSGSGATAVGEYCQVTGSIAPVDRSAPPIQFNVSLPTNWNEKAIHLFGGGYDGFLVPGGGNVPGASGFAAPLARGYAGFGSNGGHTGDLREGSFALNEEALENELADHLRKTRDVAVAIIVKRYGKTPTRTYAAGGSGGGRQALYVADRWPALYDGVIAYYPAWSLTAMLINYTETAKALAVPGAWSNPAKQRLLSNAVVTSCDALDGATDGIVSNVAGCRFDPGTLRCANGTDAGDTCLSDAQIAGFGAYNTALNLPFSLANGTRTYPAYNIFDGGLIPAMGSAPPASPSTFDMPFAMYIGDSFARYYVLGDSSYNSLLFSHSANGYIQHRLQYISARQDVNPNMSAFAEKGGKVLLIHGMADPLIPAATTDEFYNRAGTAMGVSTVNSFMRYFQVPGYGHGSGAFNLSFDSLTALEQWVEVGTVPTGLIARDANPASNSRTRPLCEYPTWPLYNGSGDVNAAASYTCVRS